MIHRFTIIEKLLLAFNILPHPVLDALTNVVAGRALQVGMKLGLFDVLGDGAKSLQMLAKECKASETGILVLLECLTAMGYVQKTQEGHYRFTRRGKKFLSKDSAFTTRNLLLFADLVLKNLLNLEESIKLGGPKNADLDLLTDEEWRIFTKSMLEVARSSYPEVLKLTPLPDHYKKLLDLGGMHGLFAIEYCRKYPGLTAEIMDFPPTAQYANALIEKYQMRERVRFRAGDFMKDDLGNGYDIVLGFNIIHAYQPEANQFLVAKVFRALNKGGTYIVKDQIKNMAGGSSLSQLFAAAMGLMLFNNAGGRTYSFEEVKGWMGHVGLHKIQLKKMRVPGYALIIGIK